MRAHSPKPANMMALKQPVLLLRSKNMVTLLNVDLGLIFERISLCKVSVARYHFDIS